MVSFGCLRPLMTYLMSLGMRRRCLRLLSDLVGRPKGLFTSTWSGCGCTVLWTGGGERFG
jgi:hypothetical protein